MTIEIIEKELEDSIASGNGGFWISAAKCRMLLDRVSKAEEKMAAIESQEPFAWFLDINFNENIAGPYRSKEKAELAELVVDAEYKKVLPLYEGPVAMVPDRIAELAERLVAPGPKCCALSASECHEISDFIRDLTPVPSRRQEHDTERTAKDYAIEHAEYMAVNAEHLIEHLNEIANVDDGTLEPDDRFGDYVGGLRLGIYEFRKRRDRCIDNHKEG